MRWDGDGTLIERHGYGKVLGVSVGSAVLGIRQIDYFGLVEPLSLKISAAAAAKKKFVLSTVLADSGRSNIGARREMRKEEEAKQKKGFQRDHVALLW